MIYDERKLEDLIERLETIKEYDYISYTLEDEELVNNILLTIEAEVEKWEKLQNENYSY